MFYFKYWHELKYRARKRDSEIRQHARGTGGGPAKKPLTLTETRILQILGVVSYAGNSETQIPVPHLQNTGPSTPVRPPSPVPLSPTPVRPPSPVPLSPISLNEYFVFLLLIASGLTLSADPCCPNNEIIKPRGFCDNNSTEKINLNCEMGHMLLRDIILKGNMVSTQDSPNYIFVEDPALYCLGQMYRNATDTSQGLIPVAVTCFEKIKKNNDIETGGVLTLISVVFLLATFAIYVYLPQMRDLQGVCYMCMCASMAFGFLSLGVLQLSPGFRGQICTITGFLVYFWMIATFSWMNVISINMFRTVLDASYLKKTERKQLLIYNCYGWGFAIFFLVVSLITDMSEGDHFKPGIGDNSCWFSGRTETWIFFYGPIATLITANVVLFLMSSLILWTSTRKYEVNKLNNLKHKFLISLKLFLVMGISWIFEIASFAHGESHIIWRIMDIFNCLQGVVIFLILVVFRKRVIQGLASDNCCLFVTRPWAEKLSPDDDEEDQEILADDTVEVRLN